jgi:glycosyltransferase involved in cell wall biosynthesis
MSHGVESRILVELEHAAKLGFYGPASGTALRHAVLWGWRERLAFRLAHHVFCLSKVDSEYLQRHCGVQAERLTTFANGTDWTDEQVDVSGATNVLFLGSWTPEKGARILPPIWRRVRELQSGARLLLAGTGCEREAVLASFAPEDQATISVIPRFQRLEEIWPAIQRCALYVLPSLREGSPLALLETMVRGLPPVAAAVGGVPELLDHGREGYLYHPLDIEAASRLIVRLLSDPRQRSILGRAARERALHSTWAVAAEAMDRGCLAAISRNSDAGHDTLRAVDSRSRSSRDPNLRRGA